MSKPRVYVSFDFDNDEALKHLIVGQAKNENTPFELADWSIKEAISSNWKTKAEDKIKLSDVVLVLVGEKTHCAQGVLVEVKLAKKYWKKIVQIKGRANSNPTSVSGAGVLHEWSWDNLRKYLKP